MLVTLGYKYRFYPTEEQEKTLSSVFGCSRVAYNWFLKNKNEALASKTPYSYNKASKEWTLLKKEEDYNWLNDNNASVPQQQALRHCSTAFSRYFKKQAEKPVCKKKRGDQSATYTSNAFTFNNKILCVSGLGNIKIRWSRTFKVRVSSITISKSRSNKYFVSFCVTEEKKPLSMTGQRVGIDMGLKDLAILSNGVKIPNPRFLRSSLKKLKHLQRSLDRKQKGSNRREVARQKLARQHEKIKNQRQDCLHKLTWFLVNNFDVIKIEDLNIPGMLKNHKLALSISDVGWGSFKEFLKYKCIWYGKDLQMIDRWFPSSQLCSKCGYRNKNLKLSDREWICPVCGTKHDRDANSSKNVENAEGHSVCGRGEGVSLNSDAKLSSMKRQPPDTEDVCSK